jgi:hypothetical protein
MQMAKQLIEGMTTDRKPEQCNDEDHEARGARLGKMNIQTSGARAFQKAWQRT